MSLQEKREIAKKEGRLLTKKQKEERAAAELRREALLKSGVIVEGLQQGGSAPAQKKVSYGSRKKKPGQTAAPSVADTASPAPGTPEPLHEEDEAPATPAKTEEKAEDSDAWDASDSDGDAKSPAPVPPTPQADGDDDSPDDWEKDSDDEPPAKPAANGKSGAFSSLTRVTRLSNN